MADENIEKVLERRNMQWQKTFQDQLTRIENKVDANSKVLRGNGDIGLRGEMKSLVKQMRELCSMVHVHRIVLMGDPTKQGDSGMRGKQLKLEQRQLEQDKMIDAIKKLFWATITAGIVGLINLIYALVKFFVEANVTP